MSDTSQGSGWWLASDGRWYPPRDVIDATSSTAPGYSQNPAPPAPAPAPPQQQAFLLTIGDIGVTPDLVVTPNGNGPLAGSQWIVTDRTVTTSTTPTWAIVLAVVFLWFCLLSLFFLLVKEARTTGYVEVSVRAGGVVHMTQLPVSNPNDVARHRHTVGQAQALAAQAGHG